MTIGCGSARGADTGDMEQRGLLALSVPDRWMSSQHAQLRREDGSWVLEDGGSKNGTYVGGQPVSRKLLEDGDLC